MDLVERWVQLSYRRPLFTAGAVAILVGVCGVLALPFEQRGGRSGDATLLAAVIVCAAASGLVLKRTRPWWALTVTFAGAAGYVVYAGEFNAAAVLPVSVCLCAIASRFEARTAVAAAVGVCVALSVVAAVVGPHWLMVERVGLIGWPLLGASIGGVTRARNRYVTAVETRAQVSAALYEFEAQRRVLEERMRISRDIHDVVAHHLAALNLQIGTALHLLDRPDTAAAALAGLQENSEAALREIKGLVGMLREEDVARSGEPPLGIDDVDALVAAVRASGLDVRAKIRGRAGPASPDVGLAAYRVIQEALTNAAKHAPHQAVTLLITYRATTLTIEVANRIEVDAESPTGAGFGLAGMAERVRAAGGRLASGGGDGEFVVSVELPLATSDRRR